MTGCTPKLGYGGNYELWWRQMLSILKVKRLHWTCERPYRSSKDPNSVQKCSAQAALMICNEINISLLFRVPLEDRFDAHRLLDHLIRLCKPFRLLDLPAELRLCIYDTYYSMTCPHSFLLLEGYSTRAKVCGLPPLTRTGRQVRTESLASFVAFRTLQLSLPACVNEEKALQINRTIRAWATKSAKAYIKHIRTVRFDVFPTSDCTLTFTEESGLRISFNGQRGSDAETEERLVAYIKGIEEDRKALDLKGESIILAMIKDPKVWICKASMYPRRARTMIPPNFGGSSPW